MNIELLKELNIELPDALSEFLESGHEDLGDHCHEMADGSEHVIYYHKAEALYSEASTEERDEAESTIEDCGGFGDGKTMADRFTQLAFWIICRRIEAVIREQLEWLQSEIGGKIEDLDARSENLLSAAHEIESTIDKLNDLDGDLDLI